MMFITSAHSSALDRRAGDIFHLTDRRNFCTVDFGFADGKTWGEHSGIFFLIHQGCYVSLSLLLF